MSRPPGLFISSTCFDLRQIRADLLDFAASLGLEPVLSEFDSFPIDPDLSTVDNCIRAVEERADILLLIVGKRYGSIAKDNKSVTNLEYTKARAKGIPIYVFVHRSIIDLLELWKANPEADFGTVVDSVLVFKFVDQIRRVEGLWVFPFDLAQDIILVMRKQLAFLFMDALTARSRLREAAIPDSLNRLSAKALRILVDRPAMWEQRLFACHLADEIARAKQYRLDFEYGLALGKHTRMDAVALIKWCRGKMDDLGQLLKAPHKIFEVALPDALGPPGIPGDPEKLVYTAERLGEVYLEVIRWSAEFWRVSPEPEQERLVQVMGQFASSLIRDIELFTVNLPAEIERVLRGGSPGSITLVLTAPDAGPLNEEVEKILRRAQP